MMVQSVRPVEATVLLNPAFCGNVIRHCIKKYEKEANEPMPYSLVFLILPIVLHKRSRENIPKSTKLSFHSWVQSNSQVRIEFAERARGLNAITREALIFLAQRDLIRIDRNAAISISGRTKKELNEDKEVIDCYKKAESVGKWFARAGSISMVFTSLGVKP